MQTQTTTETKSKVRTGVVTAVIGAALIAAAAAGLVIKSQDTGLSIGGSTFNFGKVMTKETVEKVFVLQNTEKRGDFQLKIAEPGGAFVINKEVSTCQTTLAAGKSCKLAVKFTPSKAVKYKKTFIVRYVFNKKTKSVTLKLQGEGVPSETDGACVDSDVTDKNFAGMSIQTYKYVNVFKMGHVKGLNPSTQKFMEADDKCWNEKRILEYYCNEKTGLVSWNSYDCPGICEDGECKEVECSSELPNSKGVALNGSCSWECSDPWTNEDGKEENGCECNTETKEGCPVSKCNDSDGGIVFEKMGMIQGLNPVTGEIIVKTDSCPDIFKVSEYYCDGDYVAVDNQTPGAPPLTSDGTKCPEGMACYDNACKPCVWKDLGYTACKKIGNKYYESKVSLTPNCEISATNSVDGIKYCGDTATSCVDGKCVQMCQDSDNGEDIYTQGIVKGHWGCPEENEPIVKEEDVCVDENHVTEFICNAGCDNILSTEIECPTGTSCSQGACKELATATQMPDDNTPTPAELPVPSQAMADLAFIADPTFNVSGTSEQHYINSKLEIQNIGTASVSSPFYVSLALKRGNGEEVKLVTTGGIKADWYDEQEGWKNYNLSLLSDGRVGIYVDKDIAAGSNISITVRLPSSIVRSGVEEILAIIDPTNEITEIEKANNSKVINFSSILVDYEITNVTFNLSATQSIYKSAVVEVTNKGNGPATYLSQGLYVIWKDASQKILFTQTYPLRAMNPGAVEQYFINFPPYEEDAAMVNSLDIRVAANASAGVALVMETNFSNNIQENVIVE